MLPNVKQGFGVGRSFWNTLKMEIDTSFDTWKKRNPCSLDSLLKCVRLRGIEKNRGAETSQDVVTRQLSICDYCRFKASRLALGTFQRLFNE
jgi:hypothetical protein